MRYSGAGLIADGDGIDQNHQLPGVHQRIGEVVAADAEIDDTHVWRHGAGGKAMDDFDTEGVIAEKDVADTGDEDEPLVNVMRPPSCDHLRHTAPIG